MAVLHKSHTFNLKNNTMDIVKILATLLTIVGMALLIFACFAVMKGSGTLLGVPVENMGFIAPTLLGGIFFAGGLYLFKYMMNSNKR